MFKNFAISMFKNFMFHLNKKFFLLRIFLYHGIPVFIEIKLIQYFDFDSLPLNKNNNSHNVLVN